MGWWLRWCLPLFVLVGACSPSPPEKPHDLCSIFREREDWYEAARDSYRRWGVPVPTQLAVIQRESSFRSDARPPRRWYLGFIPGARLSSAYGYGQVLDDTWERYSLATDNLWANRADFADVTDFIGWYGQLGETRYGIPKKDVRAFYASYHVGHSGYRQGLHHRHPTARRAIGDVERRAAIYATQYARCQKQLDDSLDSWWPF